MSSRERGKVIDAQSIVESARKTMPNRDNASGASDPDLNTRPTPLSFATTFDQRFFHSTLAQYDAR